MDELVKQKQKIEVGGLVMCPLGFQKGPCQKQACELWVSLKAGETTVGRCAYAWQAIVAVETREAITGLTNRIENLINGGLASEK